MRHMGIAYTVIGLTEMDQLTAPSGKTLYLPYLAPHIIGLLQRQPTEQRHILSTISSRVTWLTLIDCNISHRMRHCANSSSTLPSCSTWQQTQQQTQY